MDVGTGTREDFNRGETTGGMMWMIYSFVIVKESLRASKYFRRQCNLRCRKIIVKSVVVLFTSVIVLDLERKEELFNILEYAIGF